MKNKIIVPAAVIVAAAWAFAGEWHIEIPDGTGDAGWRLSLVLDKNDKPHISYDYGFTGGENLMYAYKEGSIWRTEIVDNSVEYSMCATSIAVDSGNQPRIAARPGVEYRGLRYAEKSGAEWNTITVDGEVKVTTVALTVDSHDHPRITYDDNEKNHLKYAYYEGSSWNISTVDTTPQSAIGYIDMAIDTANHLHVIYTHDGKLKYAHYDGVKWGFEVIVDNASLTRPAIAVDVNYNPHVIYYDEGTDYIVYAYYDSSRWNVENVIKLDPVGSPDPAIAVDPKRDAHIAYSKRNSMTDKDLAYGHRKGGTWEITVVDDEGDLGLFVDIALDSFEFPHIAYHRCTGYYGQLKYAWYYDDIGIDLADFCASGRSESQITLTWRIRATGREKISGFNLYRRARGATSKVLKGDNGNIAEVPWVKVNSSPIAGINPYTYADTSLEPVTKYQYRLEAIVKDKAETLGTTYGTTLAVTKPFALHAAFPNPSRGDVTFAFSLPEAGYAELAVYDLAGRRLATPIRGGLCEGEHEVQTALDLAPGIYIYRLQADGLSAARRLAIVK